MSVRDCGGFSHVLPFGTAQHSIFQSEYSLAKYPVTNLQYQAFVQATCYNALIWATACLDRVAAIFIKYFCEGQMLEGVRFVNPFAPGFQLRDWA